MKHGNHMMKEKDMMKEKEMSKRMPKLGTGERFAALKSKLAKRIGKKKVKNPGALAAAIGRKKFGKKKFQKLAAAGKKRKSKS